MTQNKTITQSRNFYYPHLAAAIVAGILLYIYYPTFAWMADRWIARDSYYSHGFLIPLVTLYWIWKDRQSLQPSWDKPQPWAYALLGACAAVQLASSFLRIYFVSCFSFVVILFALTQLMFGIQVFRRVWYPIFFLSLMVPLPLLVISQVTLQMKFFVATVATSWIKATGIPAIREGSYIHMPNAVMLVGDPCSGLRSFLAILCLGFFLAHDMKSSVWHKIAFIISGWPIAILCNVFRVYFLGLVADIYGSSYAQEGAIPHDMSGYLVFVIAFLALLWIRRKMELMHVRQTA